MNILFLKGFCNYFNRVVKKYSTLSDYMTHSTSSLNLNNINFNPNDGIITELIIGDTNQTENNAPLAWENNGTPDYAICYEGSDANTVIRSRWFVLESERTRLGQYRLALKRDSIVDNWDTIINAPCFIEKGIINDISNPLIFNSEDMVYNQIKTDEILLKDRSKSAWVVAYIPRDADPGTIQADLPFSGIENYSVNGINTWEFWDYTVNADPDNIYKHHIPSQISLKWLGEGYGTWSGQGQSGTVTVHFRGDFVWKREAENVMDNLTDDHTVNPYIHNPTQASNPMSSANVVYNSNSELLHKSDFDNKLWAVLEAEAQIWDASNPYQGFCKVVNKTTYGAILAHNGKIIKDTSTGRFYKINVVIGDEVDGLLVDDNITYSQTIMSNTYAARDWATFWGNYSLVDSSASRWPYFNSFKSQTLYISLEEVHNQISMVVPAPAARYHLQDQPYDMLCIPYSPITIKEYNVDVCTANGLAAMNIATALTIDISDGLTDKGTSVYDIQLLPYCPIQEMIIGNTGVVDYGGLFHSPIKDNNNNVINVCFYCSKSDFSFNINNIIEIDHSDSSITPIDLKVSNECDLWRLSSPNWSSSFEFSVAKMGGRVSRFHVDCSYRPYQPYIHICPEFSGLYGQPTFNNSYDARGLVCGGDFSLPQLSNAWSSYVLNNKNYQTIFDRQMQNLDVNNQISMEQQKLSAVMGTLTGGIGGAAGGAMAGAKAGPYGAIAGAIIGGAAGTAGSIVGGMKDIEWLQRQQSENRDYQVDMYGYNLQNIQAIPTGLTKITAYNPNNKIWPVLERYTATDTEKQALRNKLQYDGMTIMVIGSISDYPVGYIQGKMIRMDALVDDSHIADDIYKEVSKGLYIGG